MQTTEFEGIEPASTEDQSIVEPFVGGKKKNERVRYRGRSYAMRVGPRGGRYVVVNGKKVYPD